MADTRRANPPEQLSDIVRNYLDDRLRDSNLELPMLAQVVSEVMQMCQSRETDAAEISRVLHRDQPLAGNVLKIANSALYTPRAPIISLQQAVSRLGLRRITEIALMASVRAHVFQAERHMDFVKAMWRRSVATGCFAKEVARLRRRNAESTFLCGLFHNVGKPIVLDALMSLEDEMGRSLGLDEVHLAIREYHTRVGAKIAREWRLPPQVTESIMYHNDYRSAPSFGGVAMTVGVAMRLAEVIVDQDRSGWPKGMQHVKNARICADLELSDSDLETLMGHFQRISQIVESMQ